MKDLTITFRCDNCKTPYAGADDVEGAVSLEVSVGKKGWYADLCPACLAALQGLTENLALHSEPIKGKSAPRAVRAGHSEKHAYPCGYPGCDKSYQTQRGAKHHRTSTHKEIIS